VDIRGLHRDDRDSILDLWNRATPFDALSAELLEEKAWGDPDFDPELALVAVDDGEVVGFVVGVLRGALQRGYVKLLAVEPGHQRQGIGRALLARVETRLAEQGARSIRLLESAPNYLVPGIDTRYEAALAFAAAAGYGHVGNAQNLSVDLAGTPPARAVPDGVEVRRATQDDATALYAFLDRHWPSWQAEATVALRNELATLHLALRDERIVGFSASDANNLGTGWFGPMGIAPDERRSGIG